MSSFTPAYDGSVTLAVGTSHWNVTPESEAFQHEVLAVMKQYNVTHLDTARAYVRDFLSSIFLYFPTNFNQRLTSNI